MVEQLTLTAWRRSREYARRISRRAAIFPPGLTICIAVVVLVGARCLWVAGERARREEIALAFGSVGYLYQAPQPDHAGNQILYVQTTTNGVGLFLCDTATGQRQLVTERSGAEKSAYIGINPWPWSPDDRLFAYSEAEPWSADDTVMTNAIQPLIIASGDTGKAIGRVETGDQDPKRLAWLTRDSLAYISQNSKINLVKKQADGTWQRTLIEGVKGQQYSFTALDSNTVAWTQSNIVWTLDLSSRTVSPRYQAPAGQILESFVFSPQNKTLLLKMHKGYQASVWQLAPGGECQNLGAYPPYPGANNWILGTNGGFACLPPRSDSRFLLVQKSPSEKPLKLFTHGNIQGLAASADGRRLFFTGVVSNDYSESLWQYDIPTDTLRCLVPSTTRPSKYARHIEALPCTLKLSSNHIVKYYLYPPADFDRRQHRKYPLVIGDTVYSVSNGEHQNRAHGPLWAEAVACSGAYVVIIDRPGWYLLDEWETNVMAVYQHLAQHPTIDTGQVFLFGASAETSPLSQLAQGQPGLWKGLLLLNPGQMPELDNFPSGQPAPRILISAGDQEHEDKRFQQYQLNAMSRGVPVEAFAHTNSTHFLVSVKALQERTKAMVHFIFDE